jgi:zinc finger protein DZIP1
MCSAIKAALMQRVTGQPPEALAALIEDELRVVTENPYEYEEDDEEQFRSTLPHEVPGALHGGVLTVQEHPAQVRLRQCMWGHLAVCCSC